jgi:hypothetical protein
LMERGQPRELGPDERARCERGGRVIVVMAFHRAMASAAAKGATQCSPVRTLVSTSSDKTADTKLRERARWVKITRSSRALERATLRRRLS